MDNFSALEAELKKRTTPAKFSAPVILNLAEPAARDSLQELLSSGSVQEVRDDYQEQLRELFAIQHPTEVYAPGFAEKFQQHYQELGATVPIWQQGNWAYFPWLRTLVHLLPDKEFQRVRTARNRNLVTEAEQQQFYQAAVGIGGLSVGNSVALNLVLSGGAGHIKLADFDSLALTNLNRVRAGVQYLGLPKVELTARQIYELNPYAQVELFPHGLTPETLDAFLDGLDLVIDELDTIGVKLLIRERARARGLPVLMGADNGDNIIVDIERYDLPSPPANFHGRLGQTTYEELTHLDKFGIGRTITKMLGAENITERMQASLGEMGKTIVSWPQLGGAALLNGVAVAYCARRILTKNSLVDNRAIVSLDELFVPEYDQPEEVQKRQRLTQEFKKIFGLE